MRSEVAEVVEELRASGRAELLRVVQDAGLDAAPELPEPEVVEPYRWLLARIGDGVTLTPGGYLPTAVVAEAMQTLGWVDDWPGRNYREDLTIPVLELRESARHLGLVRVSQGRLLVTAAGRRGIDDPAALLRHLVARLPIGRSAPDRQAGLLWLLAVAAGRRRPEVAVELTVTLRDVEPPVWRRLAVPERTTLLQLHDLLQAAMGWRGAHLYLFEVDGVHYGEVEDMEDQRSPRTLTVGSLPDGAVVRYDYDFGDGWEHDVRVDAHRTAEAPVCLDGARACPPEDCGGPHGYARLLEIMRDPRHPEYAELIDWVDGPFDPEAFDRDAATRELRRRARRPR